MIDLFEIELMIVVFASLTFGVLFGWTSCYIWYCAEKRNKRSNTTVK